jgi:glutathione synthase
MGYPSDSKEGGLCSGSTHVASSTLQIAKPTVSKDLSLGIFRSDYMIHQDPSDPGAKPHIKQVEFNTIASSFGGLASKVSSLHK